MQTAFSPLDGLTVLDFSHALAGPYCTMLLAAYGARVIKIESPAGGDIGRSWGPPFLGADAAYFVGLNSGKKSLAIDLKTREGVEICRTLAAQSDIIIENFRPGTMNRLGLSYAVLSELNPRLIYISVSGYGQTGPRRDEPAMDLIIQAASGIMSITGTAEGETVKTGHAVADVTSGIYSLIGALLAVLARHRTGEGQFIDVSMMDTLMSTMSEEFVRYLACGKIPGPMGTSIEAFVPYRSYMCSDREVTVAITSDLAWGNFCEAIGRTDLTRDPRYSVNSSRVVNRDALDRMLEGIFKTRPAAYWIGSLSERDIPCALVHNLEEAVIDPQTKARDMILNLQHAEAGPVRVTGLPIKLSETPGNIKTAAPTRGADTAAVLSELLGLQSGEIDRLRRDGVIS